MTTYYTDNYADAFNQSPGKLIPAAEWGGAVRQVNEIYETPEAGIASGSTICVCRPPKGFRLIGGYVISDNLTNNATLAVGVGIDGGGNAAVTDKFLAATNHGGGAAVKTDLLPAAKIDSVAYEFDGETDLTLTTGTGTAVGTIRVVPLFACPM